MRACGESDRYTRAYSRSIVCRILDGKKNNHFTVRINQRSPTKGGKKSPPIPLAICASPKGRRQGRTIFSRELSHVSRLAGWSDWFAYPPLKPWNFIRDFPDITSTSPGFNRISLTASLRFKPPSRKMPGHPSEMEIIGASRFFSLLGEK